MRVPPHPFAADGVPRPRRGGNARTDGAERGEGTRAHRRPAPAVAAAARPSTAAGTVVVAAAVESSTAVAAVAAPPATPVASTAGTASAESPAAALVHGAVGDPHAGCAAGAAGTRAEGARIAADRVAVVVAAGAFTNGREPDSGATLSAAVVR